MIGKGSMDKHQEECRNRKEKDGYARRKKVWANNKRSDEMK